MRAAPHRHLLAAGAKYSIFQRGGRAVVFTILSRVQVEGGTVVAVAVALPMESGVLAEVRTCNCISREEAAERVDSMAHSLRLDVVARGDLCVE